MMVNKSSVLAWSAEECPEEGSGTVLALTIIAALLVLTVVIAGLIGAVSANRRASATVRTWNPARSRTARKRWR